MTSKLPKALIFDLDDTLLDFGGSSETCWDIVCERYASEAGVSADAFVSAIREYRDWYWSDPDRHREGRLRLDAARQDIVKEALRRLGAGNAELGDRIGAEYSAMRDDSLCLFPKVLDLLASLQDKGVRLAMITNGEAHVQRGKIVRFGLEEYFDCILIEGEFGVGKPDERVYLHALDQLNVTPSEVWMIGDNLVWDVAAPQRLGITGIWYDGKGSGLPPASPVQPDRIIGNLAELLQDGHLSRPE